MDNILNYAELVLNSYVNGEDIENLSGKEKRAARKEKNAPKKEARKTKRKVKVEKLKKGIRTAVTKFGAVGVLIPFKGIMSKRLKELGVNTDEMKLDEIALKFYDMVIKKKSDYEVSNFAVPPQVIAGVVQGVIAFFKNLIDRKKRGEQLSPSEEKLAGQAEEVSEQVDDVTQDLTEETIGEQVIKYLPYAVGAGVLFYFLTRKK